MNRGDLRTAALDLASWHADTDDDFVAEVNRAIDRAVKNLSSRAPDAFVTTDERLFLYGDRTNTTLTRTLANTDDEFVLTFGTSSSGTTIKTDGSWDGTMHLEVTVDGKVLRFQCREFWDHKVAGPYQNHYLVSLDRPCTFTGKTGLAFRLYQPRVHPASDVKRILDGRLFDSNRSVMSALPPNFARLSGYEDYKGEVIGLPIAMARGPRFQLPAPIQAPTVTAHASTNWSDGQEAPGSFKYRYTHVWGRREPVKSPRGSFDPLFESSPSPESATFTVAAVGSDAALVTMTNTAWRQHFDPNPTTTRSGRSGWRKRLYRARVTKTASGATESNVEVGPDVWEFLAEVEDDATTYTDDGTAIPEYERRIPESAGYWGWSMLPHQDADYELDLRVQRTPAPLRVDTDAPNVDPAYDQVLVLLLLREIALMDKKPDLARGFLLEFQEALGILRAEQENSSSHVPGTHWRPTPDTGERALRYGPYKEN